ncbi:uncharacterized protein LOC131940594 [Physella acuta]|uniref:uncharacterized protein LOC131940594 n=1 Tax=Physella acuta TaxID=109671 RepID=UPI0027DB7066|nr:uncharacterized protein LOC131940594 [Physella acuta]
MLSSKESVRSAMDKSDTATTIVDNNNKTVPVDYYYIEALRYLSCKSHKEGDSECRCMKCRGKDGDSEDDSDSSGDDATAEAAGKRERSWSQSMAEEYESGAISQLPNMDESNGNGRLTSRRFSDGMLLKSEFKVSNGRVHWADDVKKELTRSRPRKKYVRNPTLKPTPIKSILKNASDENLVIEESLGTSY